MKRILAMFLFAIMLCSCASGQIKPNDDFSSSVTEATTSAEYESNVVTESTTAVTTTERTSPDTSVQTDETTTETEEATVATEEITVQTTTEETTASEKNVDADDKSPYDGFLHAEGTKVIGPDGNEIMIKGISLGNDVYQNPSVPNYNHHTEETFKELAELGFNSVRFYINYGIFEDDDNPYVYKEEGFKWLDMNVQWAKKYGIGLIFNMHYPQGGYQSGGDGLELWNDESNQKRLAALWRAIAERYADEPTVWGFGLINEPILPWHGSMDASVEMCKDLMQYITDEIREVSNQAVFIEKLCNARNPDGTIAVGWEHFIPENVGYVIDDDNAIYEFHCYSPHNFSHQNLSWSNTLGVTMSYPSDEITESTMLSYWVSCTRAKEVSSSNGWTYFESDPITLTDEYNMAALAFNAARLGENGAAYFDDATVIEISPDGTERIIYSYDFSDNKLSDFSLWSKDGSGKAEYTLTEGNGANGCIKISGSIDDYVATGKRFALKEGYKYKVTGYIKLENTTSKAYIRIDHALAESYYIFNKDYLESELLPYVEFSKEYNVPIYLGEFGVNTEGFKENRNGEAWVADMIDICYKYGIGFNYHTYHETSFGLYMSYAYILPEKSDLNRALYDCFAQSLK